MVACAGSVGAQRRAAGDVLLSALNRTAHWEHVYATKDPSTVSWYQPEATRSLALIERVASDRGSRIVDVGGGASALVDGLLQAGYQQLTVVDIASAALAIVQQRLGSAATSVEWRAGDVLNMEFPPGAYDVWHDRALFHFLTEAADRAQYIAQVRRALAPDGLLIVGTFALDGPARCSSLDTARYSAAALEQALGIAFRPVASERELHTTPSGAQQAFSWSISRYVPPAATASGS